MSYKRWGDGIDNGSAFTWWCEACWKVPSHEVKAVGEEGGDWDETVYIARHECGTEAFEGGHTYVGHRRVRWMKTTLTHSPIDSDWGHKRRCVNFVPTTI